jgi:hypothetical protein
MSEFMIMQKTSQGEENVESSSMGELNDFKKDKFS